MADKYLVIFTNKETGKYDHFDLYPKDVCTEEELKNKIIAFNQNNFNLKAEWHNNDIFTDFVEDISSVEQKKNLMRNLQNILNNLDTTVSELESWKDSIQEMLEDADNDR